MQPLPRKAHWNPGYIYVQTAAIAVAVWFVLRDRYQDDAYISLIYARHLLQGYGLSWNPGEHVEGYSNFLFILLTAGLGWLGIDLQLATNVLNALGYAGMVGVIAWFTHRYYLMRFTELPQAYAYRVNEALCVALAASSVIVLAWCLGGMEEMFFTGLLTGCAVSILSWLEFGGSHRQALLTGALFALTALTRLEGALFWGLSGLFLTGLWLTGRARGNVTFMRLALLAVGFLAIFTPYWLWRVQYFGQWWPNAIVAKTLYIDRYWLYYYGWYYLAEFLILPPNLPLFAGALFLITWRNQRLSAPFLYLLALIVPYMLMIEYAGGDHMAYDRFWVPMVPLLALGIYYGGNALIPENEKRFRDICGALIVLSVLQFGMVKADSALSPGALSGESVAPYIDAHWPRQSLIAINAAGALPYAAPDYRYIDMLGLNDKTIAQRDLTAPDVQKKIARLPVGHLKGDGAYVLSRQPDYIIFGYGWGDEKPRFLSDQEIDASPEFHRDYTRVEIYIDPPLNLLPALEAAAEANRKALRKSQKDPHFVRGPVLNDQHQLRFIYWQRKK